MRAYIAVSYSKRKLVNKEITLIIETLNTFDISAFVFVDNYKFNISQEKQMMLQAMQDIENCEILIAETSEKGIGIGIEVGYAKAKGKIVIYVRHQNAEHSTTVSGISDFQIIYSNHQDMQIKLIDIIRQLN
jgi:2'-deoxynucleoside 5'-phosphate N-hydrolase